MDKPTKKRNTYNTEIINRLKIKYGVSKRYINMSLSGDRQSETADKIKADYKVMELEVTKTLNKL